MADDKKYETLGQTGTKSRIPNNVWAKGRKNDNKTDKNLFRVNQNDEMEFEEAPAVLNRGTLAINSPGANSIERMVSLASLVQNTDGGWDIYENIDSENLRNPATASPANQFGTWPRVIVEGWDMIVNPFVLKAAKTPLDSSLSIVVHPSTNRMFVDRVIALITAGKTKSSNPLAFASYYAKGLAAFKAEIDFYKAIQVWHNDGNPANANPPTGQITTIIDTRPLDVDAIPMSQAARRLINRFNLMRAAIPNLIFYDVHQRCEIANALQGELHDGEDIRVFGLEAAKILRDENYLTAGIDYEASYCISAIASATRVFNIFKNDHILFLNAWTSALTDLKGRIIPSGDFAGWYALTDGIDINDLDTYIAGDKQDQGQCLLALVDSDASDEAVALANKLIETQSGSGQYVDIFDIALGEAWYQEASGNCALGIIKCLKAGII